MAERWIFSFCEAERKAKKRRFPKETALVQLSHRLLAAKALVEALNASAGVNQLLLARVERVALGANFDVDLQAWSSGSGITLPHAQVMVQST